MPRTSGRRIDMSTPFVGAMMPDGSRLQAAIPDITRRHMAVNIRKFVIRKFLLRAHSLDELVALVKTRLKRTQYGPGLLAGFLVSTDLEFGPFL
jgi:Flp pilus assembly CpaF family ATPase